MEKENMSYWIWSVLCLIITYFICKIYRRMYYFSNLGIPQPPEWPIIGVMHYMLFPRRHIYDLMTYMYNTNKGAKYIGTNVFLMPTIVIRDLELIKSVLIKNFDHFADRKSIVDEKNDPLFGKNLILLNGDRWREVRSALTPAFTSSKLKSMYTLISACAENFVEELLKKYKDKDAVDIKDVFGKYTNSIIASCAFGIEVDSLKDPENEFYIYTCKYTQFKGIAMIKLMLEMLFPRLTRKMGMRMVSKKATDFFVSIVSESIKMRKEKNIIRPDMLQLMLEAKEKLTEDSAAKFDLLEMTAQAFIFILAGFEASSVQASVIAHELAVNPDVQKNVRDEIEALMKVTNNKPTYEAITNNMPYLDAVFSEALRMHGTSSMGRLCTKEFELPPALPGLKPYKIIPGQNVMIPVSAIHMDPNIYENPEIFNPSRFIDKNISICDITNLGFGLGPRVCLGSRFAMLEIKTLLVYLLAKCDLVPCEKTCIPLKYNMNDMAPIPKNGFWLKLEIRN